MNKDELIGLDDRGLAAWDAHDVDGFAEMFAADFVYNDDTVPGSDDVARQVRDYMSGWFTAFPGNPSLFYASVVGLRCTTSTMRPRNEARFHGTYAQRCQR
jgi:hypothetical protein